MRNIITFFLLISSFLVAADSSEHTKESRFHSIPLNIVDSKSPIGFLNSQVIFLSDQLERNLDKKYLASPVIVASFLNLDDFSETSNLGRILSESLIHQLHIKKWKVLDARLAQNLIINESGEFALSRDIKNIKNNYNVSGIVSGTYSVLDTGILINLKVIDIKSGLVTSSAQTIIPLDGLEHLLLDSTKKTTLKAVGSIDDIGGDEFSSEQQVDLTLEKDEDNDNDGVSDKSDKCSNTGDGFKVNKNGCEIGFVFKVLFDFDSAKLKSQSMQSVEDFATFLRKNPKYSAKIAGHADSVGTYEYNQKLSEKRAKIVYDKLITLGIDKNRLTYRGFGELEPFVSNLTAEDRAKNRRVEALLIQ